MADTSCIWFPLFLVTLFLLLVTVSAILLVYIKSRWPNRWMNSMQYVQTTVRRRTGRKRKTTKPIDTYISIVDPPMTDPNIRPPCRPPADPSNQTNSAYYVVPDNLEQDIYSSDDGGKTNKKTVPGKVTPRANRICDDQNLYDDYLVVN